jgi:hypothetical protein
MNSIRPTMTFPVFGQPAAVGDGEASQPSRAGQSAPDEDRSQGTMPDLREEDVPGKFQRDNLVVVPIPMSDPTFGTGLILGGVLLLYLDMTQDLDLRDVEQPINYDGEIRAAGIGLDIKRDSRDLPTNPWSGNLFEARAITSDMRPSERGRYQDYNLRFRTYHKLTDRMVLAGSASHVEIGSDHSGERREIKAQQSGTRNIQRGQILEYQGIFEQHDGQNKRGQEIGGTHAWVGRDRSDFAEAGALGTARCAFIMRCQPIGDLSIPVDVLARPELGLDDLQIDRNLAHTLFGEGIRGRKCRQHNEKRNRVCLNQFERHVVSPGQNVGKIADYSCARSSKKRFSALLQGAAFSATQSR